MKRLILILAAILFLALPSKAQVIRADTCHAQSCMLNVWKPVTTGNTLLVIIRPVEKQHPSCAAVPNCGNTVFMVMDSYGNSYQHIYGVGNWYDRVFAVFNAKGGGSVSNPFLIGIIASEGSSDWQPSTGGYWDFDAMILELPPATGFAAPSIAAGYFLGGGSDEIGVNPAINLTLPNPGKTLLVGWSVLRWYGAAPLQASYAAPWSLVKDDGFISVAMQETYNAGTFNLLGHYSNYGFWDAGIVVLALR